MAVAEEVLDSTGAGDAAATGMLWAILHQQPLNYALDAAYVYARSASQKYGGRRGAPTMSELRARWRGWLASPHRLEPAP